MALQGSGALSISQIRTELGNASYSLRTLSAAAGKSTPDSMSEFYGYSNATTFPSNWQYSPLTTLADPGSGNIRLNSTYLSSVTWIAVNNNGNTVSALSANINSVIRAEAAYTPTNYIELQLTSNSNNNGSWQYYTGTRVSYGGSFNPGQITKITIKKA